jgi:DNA-binding HxlR family transcriptional regulator
MSARHLSSDVDICETNCIHADIVARVARNLPRGQWLDPLADFFKLFGDGTRIRILWALSESEMCVCDLCALLNMQQSAVSHQLKNLKQSRVVKARREGKVVYYLDLGMAHLQES